MHRLPRPARTASCLGADASLFQAERSAGSRFTGGGQSRFVLASCTPAQVGAAVRSSLAVRSTSDSASQRVSNWDACGRATIDGRYGCAAAHQCAAEYFEQVPRSPGPPVRRPMCPFPRPRLGELQRECPTAASCITAAGLGRSNRRRGVLKPGSSRAAYGRAAVELSGAACLSGPRLRRGHREANSKNLERMAVSRQRTGRKRRKQPVFVLPCSARSLCAPAELHRPWQGSLLGP